MKIKGMKVVRKSASEKIPDVTLKKIRSQTFRKQMPKKCFLLPSERKFPICSLQNGEWKIDPRLVRAALVRARQHNYPLVAKKAELLLRKIREADKK